MLLLLLTSMLLAGEAPPAQLPPVPANALRTDGFASAGWTEVDGDLAAALAAAGYRPFDGQPSLVASDIPRFIVQVGVRNTAMQSGAEAENIAQITQVSPDAAWFALRDAEAGLTDEAAVRQSGEGFLQLASLRPVDPANLVGNWAAQMQSGEGSAARLIQIGWENLSAQVQDGAGHISSVVQVGEQHSAYVQQSGLAHRADVVQDGYGSSASVIQSGENNTASVRQ